MSERDRPRSPARPPPEAKPANPLAKTPSEPPPTPRAITPPTSVHPIGTPRGLSSTAGSIAVAGWLVDRGLYPPTGKAWRVKIALEAADRAASFMFSPTRFHVTIESERWSYVFGHGDRTSTIDIHNIPSARDRDEHRLLAMTPPLRRLGTLLRDLEARYHIFFRRHQAAIQTDVSGSEPIIRAWILSL